MEMEKIHQSLSFIETKGHYKWTGTENDLKLFVEGTTEETNNGKWEEDQHHNMLAFKSKDTVIKWYRGTKTLMVQGNKQKEYKDKLHGLLEVRNRAHDSVEEEEEEEEEEGGDNGKEADDNEADRPDARSECSCRCKTVLDALKKLELNVAELPTKIQDGDQRPQYGEDVKYLKDQMAKLEEQNSALNSTNITLRERIITLESERESLITANRLLYEDMKTEHENCERDYNAEYNADFTTVQHKRKPQGDRKQRRTSYANDSPQYSGGIPPRQPAKTKAGKKDATRKSVVVLGDSMVKDLKGWKMSQNKKVTVQSFAGATVQDMQHFIKPTVEKKPDEIILHIGTNDLCSASTSRQLAEKIVDLGVAAERELQDTKISISSIIHRMARNPGHFGPAHASAVSLVI